MMMSTAAHHHKHPVLSLLLTSYLICNCFVQAVSRFPPACFVPIAHASRRGRIDCSSKAPASVGLLASGEPSAEAAPFLHDDAVDYTDSPYTLDEKGRPTGVKEGTLLVETPHSGRKFLPTHPDSSSSSRLRSILKPWKRRARRKRRFTEGWYYRREWDEEVPIAPTRTPFCKSVSVTLPEYNESFVFIFSIEDAGRWIDGQKSPLTLACMQMLGPQDTYLVQSDEDDEKFWAWKEHQGFGCTFEWEKDFVNTSGETEETLRRISAMTPEEWRRGVQTGFQVLPFHFQGRLNGHDGTLGGVKSNQGRPGRADYDFSVQPIAGWGNYPPLTKPPDERSTSGDKYRQYSTAGWLASFPVFEPHWQITHAHARASGTLNWNGTIYSFKDAPFYGEKNWGGAFPTKWYWAQCNSFDEHPDLAFTAGGGIRQLPFSFLPGKRTETLGLIGIHYNGEFYEIVPWTGEMSWEVSWGRWEFRGKCTDRRGEKQFEAKVVAVTDDDVPGVLLRAPTKDGGMQYACRDSGFGSVVLSLWLLEYDEDLGDFVRSQVIVDRAVSKQCTVEVGGGPEAGGWDVWKVNSKMSTTMKSLIRLPYIFRRKGTDN